MKIRINNTDIEFINGDTIYTAAKRAGIDIPIMCFLDGYDHFSSCMVCLVKDIDTGKLIPSCSARAGEGMNIDTESEEVDKARKAAVELLLSEHAGDCEGLCTLACPAHMNIPLMIRYIQKGDMDNAIKVIKKHIALPSILSRLCDAPCERACRRKGFDDSVSICELEKFAADYDLSQKTPYIPEKYESSGKKIAVIGGGSAGLAAAYFTVVLGHQCTVFEKKDRAGGKLLLNENSKELPENIIKKEIEIIKKLGVEFKFNIEAGRDISFIDINNEYDAVIIAFGRISTEKHNSDKPGPEISNNKFIAEMGLEIEGHRIKAERKTFQTSGEGVFVCGEAFNPSGSLIVSIADGRSAAFSVNEYLRKGDAGTGSKIFNSRLGKLKDGEMDIFLEFADKSNRVEPGNEVFTKEEAERECLRCLHCDCREKDNCILRNFSEKYNARQSHYKYSDRKKVSFQKWTDNILYEPGKCIKCGICVRISEKEGIKYGPTFLNRGFAAVIGIPFDKKPGEDFKVIEKEIIENCPTGALAYYDVIKRK